MKRYLFRRILSGILTILVVLGINFVIIKAAPGDPIRTLMGPENDDPVLRAALTEKWGLDDPPLQQF
ncbi:MAG TPA: ABC transporter permease, partial [Alphaproteobacteria bacterium]|nr:ABC transporter permease [Alphaproteobacteria bacterium]